MLKINLQTNRWVLVVAILRTVLLAYTNVAVLVAPARPVGHTFIWVIYTSELLEVVLLYYMISVLVFLREKQFIKIAFLLYSGLYIIRMIFFSVLAQVVHPSTPSYLISTGMLGLFTIFSDIFLLIGCISVANKTVSTAYILFSSAITIVALSAVAINLLAPLLYRIKSDPLANMHFVYNLANIIGLLVIMMPVAAILLTKNIGKLLQAEEPQPFSYQP